MTYIDDFAPALKKRISEIEAVSAIEIVPVHFKKAKSYLEWTLFCSAILSYLIYELLWFYVGDAWLAWTLYMKALSFICFFLSFCFIFKKTNLLCYFIPKHILWEACSTLASLTFLREGIFETRDRSGILICVFEFEKKVIVLADKGFHDLVEENYWKTLAQKLAQDFNRHKVGNEFFEALTYLEKEIAPHFPRRIDDTNELKDDLVRK